MSDPVRAGGFGGGVRGLGHIIIQLLLLQILQLYIFIEKEPV